MGLKNVKPEDLETASGLRRELAKLYCELRTGEVEAKDAFELANIAGKQIGLAKARVAYYALRSETPQINFLKDDS